MAKAIAGALDIQYSKRPTLPEDSPAYVEPTLAGCAHLVFRGSDLATSTEPKCVVGNIYLGPETAAVPSAWKDLEGAKIGGIVNCTKRSPCHFQESIPYCTVAVNDEAGADILAFLDRATCFLRYCLVTKGNNVLVHC